MRVQYKQKCSRCKKNFVLTTSRQSYVVCYECSKESLKGEITNPYYQKLFDIPEEYYKENALKTLNQKEKQYTPKDDSSKIEKDLEKDKAKISELTENIRKEQMKKK